MQTLLTWAAFLVALTGAAPAQTAHAQPTQPRPVLVRLGDMAWVGAYGGLPQVVGGQVIAPALAACDLLSLNCTLGDKLTATVRYGSRKGQTQTFDLSHLNVTQPLTAFAPLARFAGYHAQWDAQNKLTRVQGTQPGSSWNWHDYFDFPPVGFTPYSGPLSASQSAPQLGKINVQQTVTAPVGLDQFMVFSRPKVGQGMQMSGSLLMGSVDVPNHFSGCGGKTTCALPVPRDALWVLALVTAK